MRILLVISAILLPVLSSCVADETCREKTEALLHAGFYAYATANSTGTDSLTVYGYENDSLLYDTKNNISTIKLPLNKVKETTIFILRFKDVNDTLHVLHQNSDFFISYACGMALTHKIDTVISTKHYIKELKIINRDINTTTDAQHLQILF